MEHSRSSSIQLFCNNVVMLTGLRIGWRLLLLLNCQRVSVISTRQTWSNQDKTFIPYRHTGLGLIHVSFNPHNGGTCIQMLDDRAISLIYEDVLTNPVEMSFPFSTKELTQIDPSPSSTLLIESIFAILIQVCGSCASNQCLPLSASCCQTSAVIQGLIMSGSNLIAPPKLSHDSDDFIAIHPV